MNLWSDQSPRSWLGHIGPLREAGRFRVVGSLQETLPMSSRVFSIQVSWALAVSTALLVATSFAWTPTGSRVRLARSVMALSRGSSTILVLAQESCDTLQGNPACTQPNVSCNTCQLSSYSAAVGGVNGGYNPGVIQGGLCGDNFQGVCQANLSCQKQMDLNVACAKPPGPPSVQP